MKWPMRSPALQLVMAHAGKPFANKLELGPPDAMTLVKSGNQIAPTSGFAPTALNHMVCTDVHGEKLPVQLAAKNITMAGMQSVSGSAR